MRPLTRPVRALAGAVLAAAVAASATVVTPTAVASHDADSARAAAKPAVGSCRDLSPRELPKQSDPDAPVSCKQPHTGRTFAVPSVPRGTAMSDLDALQRLVERTCRPAYHRAVSTSIRQRLLSAYGYVWFVPTQDQVRQGARWIRCDLYLAGGTGSLVPLPPARVPALRTAPHSDREARCYTGQRVGMLGIAC